MSCALWTRVWLLGLVLDDRASCTHRAPHGPMPSMRSSKVIAMGKAYTLFVRHHDLQEAWGDTE